MGRYAKPMALMLVAAILATPMLAAVHCQEAISSSESTLQLRASASEDDHCDAAQHGVQSVAGPQAKPQPEQAGQLAAITSHFQPTLGLYNGGPSRLWLDGGTAHLPAQPSKQLLNCTFLI